MGWRLHLSMNLMLCSVQTGLRALVYTNQTVLHPNEMSRLHAELYQAP
jgi:hypothetical protein